jgi:hypothetical protein
MKLVMIAASAAVVAFAGIGSASAQNAGPTYSNSIHQSAGDRDARGTPKYYQRERPTYRKHVRSNRAWRTTTGAATTSGPTYSRSIHQSAGDRDSRGTPKYNQEK